MWHNLPEAVTDQQCLHQFRVQLHRTDAAQYAQLERTEGCPSWLRMWVWKRLKAVLLQELALILCEQLLLEPLRCIMPTHTALGALLAHSRCCTGQEVRDRDSAPSLGRREQTGSMTQSPYILWLCQGADDTHTSWLCQGPGDTCKPRKSPKYAVAEYANTQ